MRIQNHRGSTNVAGFSDAPKPDIFLAATNEPGIVDGAKLQTQNVHVGRLLGNDFDLLASRDPRDVPHDDQLLVAFVFADTCEHAAVRRETQTLQSGHGHRDDAQAAGSRVVPDPN